MKTTDIYWKRNTLLDKQLNFIQNQWKTSERNKALLLEFKNSYSNRTKDTTIVKTLWGIRKATDLIKTDLDKITIQELNNGLNQLKNSQYAEETKVSIKKSLKQFYNWYEDIDPRFYSKTEIERIQTQKVYKYIHKKIKTTCPPKNISPTEIITNDDIKTILKKGCRNDMEKAFIKTLHETGCRIGEFLNIKKSDIVRKDSHWIIYVDGKTGPRSVYISESTPYLLRWLDYHPGEKEEDFLWISQYSNRRLIYTGALKLIKRCVTRSGLKKRFNPHWFRHSRASIYATKFSDAVRCKMMGWEIGSQVQKRYTHLQDSETERTYTEGLGLVKSEEKEVIKRNIECICGRINEPEAMYCSKCGKVLTLEVAVKEQEYMKDAFEMFSKIMTDPDLAVKFKLFKDKMEAKK